jgi:hypothetical protein
MEIKVDSFLFLIQMAKISNSYNFIKKHKKIYFIFQK